MGSAFGHASGQHGGQETRDDLGGFLARLRDGDFDAALREISLRQRRLQWERLPEHIVVLRHGESEGNINRTIYTSKGDALLELTPRGLAQACEAGSRLRAIVGDARIFAVVSPFERTQQTLLGLYRGGFPEDQVAMVHVSPQIREQEFGNFQTVGLHEAAKAEQMLVGRFYYRRPNAESSADCFDRVSAFWDDLLNNLLVRQDEDFGACVIVTHGLTMRLLLMNLFQWSVETFETVWNVGNCHHITLRKDMDAMCYKICTQACHPPNVLPWATRPVWLVLKSREASEGTDEKLTRLQSFKDSKEGSDICSALHKKGDLHGPDDTPKNDDATPHAQCTIPLDISGFGRIGIGGDCPNYFWPEIDRAIDETQNLRLRERSVAYTVLDYLNVPQPRTMQRTALRVALGHGNLTREAAQRAAEQMAPVDWDDVEFIDWWGNVLSYQAKMLRLTDATWGADATPNSEISPTRTSSVAIASDESHRTSSPKPKSALHTERSNRKKSMHVSMVFPADVVNR